MPGGDTSAGRARFASVVGGVDPGLLIGGATREGRAGAFDVCDPGSGDRLARVARADANDMDDAVAAAHRAGRDWARTPPRERAEVLARAFRLMIDRAEDLALLVTLESGKTLSDARSEIAYAAEFFRWFSEEAVRISGDDRLAPAGTHRILVEKVPVGVALLLTPWNFPAAMATRKIGPALAAGCTVVLKPAEDTPLTALALGAILAEAGAPDGVVNIVCTDRPAELSTRLLADDRIRKLSFTGSTAVGRELLRLCAPRIVNASMELGGNAPFLVLDDADLEVAVREAVVAKMRNSGQACTAANRFFVHASLHDDFVAGLVSELGRLTPGHGADPGTTLAPLITRRAVDRVSGLVQDAVSRGARSELGGTPSECFYPATVLTRVPAEASVLHEEIFGPVAVVTAFDSEDDAIISANATDVGLAGYVISGDRDRALRVARRLEVGMVGINRGLVSDAAAPFGGVKQSGLGREGGREGIDAYLEPVYFSVSE